MLVACVALALVVPATALAITLRAAHKRHISRATTFRGAPEIGTLYASSNAAQHGCTASVVHSPSENTLISAAHCITGSGVGMVFVPGQDRARVPYGRWIVTAVHLEREWVSREDDHADVAFLTVAPRTINGVSTEIEQVTGAFRLGVTAVRGQRVAVSGYPAGGANDPITCAANVYLTKTFPSFDCRGFVAGTSGSPWVWTARDGTKQIVGVIGGPYQGGCHDYTSYSSPLARSAEAAYLRATRGGSGDLAPRARGDGC